MKTITFVSGTYNEVENVEELLKRVWAAVEPFKEKYNLFVVIDNCSTDGTRDLLRKLAAEGASA